VASTKELPKVRSITYLIIAIGIFSSLTCFSQNYKLYTADDYLNSRGEVYFRFKCEKSDLSLLTKTISIDKLVADTVYAYANTKGFRSFLLLNLNYEVLVPPSMQISENKLRNTETAGLWNYYPSYEQYLSLMDSFVIKYPSLCKLTEIGTSVQGRKLLYLKISDNVSQKEAEPEFMFTSSMHGDEVTGYVLMLHLIDYLLSNYEKDSLVTSLVKNVEIWINPLANPDGTYKSGNSSVAGATRFNANNIDLNRNYPDPDPQFGQHPDGEVWQPETSASMAFMQSHNFVFSANYHGGSEVLNYPWDTWPKLHADNDWFVSVAKQYADTAKKFGGSSYFSDVTSDGYTDGYAWYVVYGGRQDYMTYFMNGREITIEVSIPKTPAATDLPQYWEYNYRSMLHYIGQCLYGIRGIVTDSVTGSPLKAKVEVLNHDEDNSFIFSSAANGNYHRMIYPGSYNLKFSAYGYIDKTIPDISVENNTSTVILNVKLSPVINSNYIPNPFSEQIEVNWNLLQDGYLSVTIYDISGQEVFLSGNKYFLAGPNLYTIPATNLAKGIYFCKISINGLPQKTVKLVKL
jgi:hypothetical protein